MGGVYGCVLLPVALSGMAPTILCGSVSEGHAAVSDRQDEARRSRKCNGQRASTSVVLEEECQGAFLKADVDSVGTLTGRSWNGSAT